MHRHNPRQRVREHTHAPCRSNQQHAEKHHRKSAHSFIPSFFGGIIAATRVDRLTRPLVCGQCLYVSRQTILTAKFAKLSLAAVLFRLGIIGVVMLGAAAAFAYVAGWLSPQRLTQASLMDAFARLNGAHPGFRRNHAKGLCVSGWFDSTGAATLLSKSAILESGRVPVIG